MASTFDTQGTWKRFKADQRGNFAIITAVGGIMVMTAVGLSIDISRALMAQTHLSNAVDSAVLSTTRLVTQGAMSEEDAKKEVKKFLFANFDDSKFGSQPTITAVKVDSAANTMSVSAHIDLPTAFMGIAGVDTQRVNWNSEAAFSNTKIEVAMALDVTGSMGSYIPGTSDTKIDVLKDAASGAIDTLIPNATAAQRVRIGLVPYAATVNAKPVISRISTTGSGKCIYERVGPNAHNDTFANGSNPVGSTKSYCPSAKIMPMTNDATKLKNHINSFSIGGCTAGHTAIAWAHYMVSPNWNGAWDLESEAASYSDAETRKYAIIMTDGIFNTHISSGNVCTSAGETNSRADALALCSEMRSRDIDVYTIAFDAPTDAAKLMEDCANPNTAQSQYYFNATDRTELENAFQAIAKDIQSLRLTG
ncbi:MAG: TadE/TadG family type IV pilus assembly protein [Pseudomonadota bacterium]